MVNYAYIILYSTVHRPVDFAVSLHSTESPDGSW